MPFTAMLFRCSLFRRVAFSHVVVCRVGFFFGTSPSVDLHLLVENKKGAVMVVCARVCADAPRVIGLGLHNNFSSCVLITNIVHGIY